MDKKIYKALSNIAEIDLSKHALIEASAGTGKTYTIENLIVRILAENENIELENILVVTFTEKATSELKYRIRKKIAYTVDFDKTLSVKTKNKLNNTLDIFDESQIFTIHGFCNTILKDFAFNLGLTFDQKLVDDIQILRSLISKQIRNSWQNIYRDKLSTLLSLSNFNTNNPDFNSNILNLALNYLSLSKNEIVFPYYKSIDLDKLWNDILSELLSLKSLMGTDHKFSKQFSKLNINIRSKKAIINNIIVPIEKIIYNFSSYEKDIIILLPIIKLLKKKTKINKVPYKILFPEKWLKSGKNIEVCPDLKLIDSKLIKLHKYFLIISNLLTVKTAENILKDSKLLKLKNGWISYKDMLELTESFLYKKTSFHNLNKLRTKYKFAFVDEFQDTDYLQWRIFKKIFLKDKQLSKLFLIGDPKQAIYSFRGADIFTYFKARKELETLAAKKKASLYFLKENWRTVPKLQQTFNYIFSSKHWFEKITSPNSYKIQYNHIKSPDINSFSKTLSHIYDNDISYQSLNIIDLSESNSVKMSKFILAKFICKKIKSIVDNPNIYFSEKNGKIKLITYNDICILVRRSSDFNFIEPMLVRNGIPYLYHNKKGLFQSIEAQYVSIILHAILESDKSELLKLALITPFFDIPIHQFNYKEDISWNHPTIQLFKLWGEYAKEKKWSILFKSIMEDSGFIFRYSSSPSWDKTEANILKIFDTLEIIARENNSLLELLQVFDKYRILPDDELGEKNFQQTSREETQVQVMTIHSSKGLEFPIVFIAGGLTNYNDRNLVNIYHENNNEQSFPKNSIQELINDEEKCLFYVAMTRACFKLYLPYYPIDKKFSWVGPICSFISYSLDEIIKEPLIKSKLDIKWHSTKYKIKESEIVTKHKVNIKSELYKDLKKSLKKHKFVNKNFRANVIAIESFSSIIKKSKKLRYKNNLNYNKKIISSNKDFFKTLDIHNKINVLPGGSKIGSMFHVILENISFNQIIEHRSKISLSEKNKYIIKMFMRTYGIKEIWFESIANIIFNVLTTPIKINNEHILFGKIPRNSRKHEVEFYFSSKPQSNKHNKKIYTSSNIVIEEKLIHGFIDMLFSFKDKIYIVDWKSNKLNNSYDKKTLKSNIIALGYNIQYKIYTAAVLKWLKQRIGNSFSLDQHFGGVLYIYLRGLLPGTQNGIYYLPFNKIKNIQEPEYDIPDLIEIYKSSGIV